MLETQTKNVEGLLKNMQVYKKELKDKILDLESDKKGLKERVKILQNEIKDSNDKSNDKLHAEIQQINIKLKQNNKVMGDVYDKVGSMQESLEKTLKNSSAATKQIQKELQIWKDKVLCCVCKRLGVLG